MERFFGPPQNLNFLSVAGVVRWLLLCGLTTTLLACGVRGSEKNPDGTPKGLGVNLVLISGNNQVTKKNRAFALPLIVQVLSPAGTPVPEMDVDFRQITNTDAQFAVKSMETPKSGLASTTVIGPSAYDEEVQIEARIRNTDEIVIFTLTTIIDVKEVEWVPTQEPPTNHTAHHLNPLASYQVRMRDYDDEIIEVNNKKNWITMSIVEGGEPALLGDVDEYFSDGIATFTDTRYIKAGTYTLRATHNKSGKYVEQTVTINPGVATQSIAVLPGQIHNTGVMTLAEAVTGSVSTLNVDSDFNVTLRAVDDYFN
ncbi:MAG: hypothetical protein KDD43_16945, partial [Bdellovibrionales bacterium]|nr:hypothetical protein [Bdellovibrionales bacterium]